jgi:ElaA protein
MEPDDPADLHWTAQPLPALGGTTVYALLQLRAAVFVVEQACPYLDPDGRDLQPGVLQLTGWDRGGALLAAARLLPPGVAFPEPSIGRVVVAPAARGRGLAHALMRRALALCAEQWPGSPVVLGAQQYLTAFYASHGFVVESDVYIEDGIPHVHMRRPMPP